MRIPFRISMAAACLVVLCLGGAHAGNITGQDWGITKSGEKASLFTLKNAHGLEARITNYGGRIVSLYVPNSHGTKTDVELGFDDLASYEKDGFYGALVGRYVGRISHGGSFTLNGKTYQSEPITISPGLIWPPMPPKWIGEKITAVRAMAFNISPS